MSSSNENDLSSQSHSKKRRIPGACDICKRKKSDSGQMPDNRCSNCVQFGFECTHREVAKVTFASYVESLEARLEKMEKLFSKFLPNVDVNQELGRMELVDQVESDILPRNDDAFPPEMLVLQCSKLNLNPERNRFFGKSSGYQLIQTALDVRQGYIGETVTEKRVVTSKRSEFWNVPQWATSNFRFEQEAPTYHYPDMDLMPALIDAYFDQVNHFLPLLHRPTFERSVAEGLHLSDPTFGATLLLVCAHGSRYSEDTRVLADGSNLSRSAGWKWFEQVNVLRKSLFEKTSLYELQMHALHVLFAQSTETPQGTWAQIGLALRLAQEVGAHMRRRTAGTPPTADDELWKRAFWVILSLDRHVSSSAGRPCGLQDEDLDLDLPLECDDEYWELAFEQPSGKPSSITFFNCYLRLMDILACAMRLIYSSKRPHGMFGKGAQRSGQQVIAELDSAMNSWMDSVPEHLRWNSNCVNGLFFKQSAALHATYYHLQIFIHRPFIPSPRNPGPALFPSLAICTNAARSCCHVLESSFSRLSALPLETLQITTFTAAVILLLNVWSGKKSGYAPNPRREMEGVQRCMEMLKASERRWASAGRFWDILTELASAGELALPVTVASKKRPRDDDPDSLSSSPPDAPIDHSRSIAGARRVSAINQIQRAPLQPSLNFALPMYSNELGRLPIYGQFDFSDSIGETSGVLDLPANYDPIIPSYLESFPMDTPSGTDAYVDGALFNGQTVESPVNQNHGHNQQTASNSADVASPSFESSFDILARFGTMRAIDDDTMFMWSTAPTSLEMDEWVSYISRVEQMSQTQSNWQT
ncbi:fungal-specific transcription factor domain-containing protein [Crassisporium funariophilum]|nr:fungal-specific transcription factor domain-containing protein [Crassisporium funariophilum]